MNSPTASMSLLKWWNCLASSPGMAREKPVPTGSTKTRSATSSSESALSTSRPGGGYGIPSSVMSHAARPERAEMQPHRR